MSRSSVAVFPFKSPSLLRYSCRIKRPSLHISQYTHRELRGTPVSGKKSAERVLSGRRSDEMRASHVHHHLAAAKAASGRIAKGSSLLIPRLLTSTGVGPFGVEQLSLASVLTGATSLRFASTSSTASAQASARPSQQQVPLFAVAGSKGAASSIPSYLDDSLWKSMASTGVHSSLLGKLQARFKFLKATPVQEAAFPVITKALEKCPEGPSSFDLTIHSETGTGKTLAYCLPLLTHLLESTKTASGLHHAKTRYLIVTPTRELAHQVYSVIQELIRPGNKRSAVAESFSAAVRAREGKGPAISTEMVAAASEAVGGSARKKKEGSLLNLGSPSASALLRVAKMVGEVSQQTLHAIDNGEAPHIIIGTPHTLSKLIPSRINCGQLCAVVLDEADELCRNYSIASLKSLVHATAGKMKHRPSLIAVSATPSHGLSTFLHANARPGTMKKINLLASSSSSPLAASSSHSSNSKGPGLKATLKAQEEELSRQKASVAAAVNSSGAIVKDASSTAAPKAGDGDGDSYYLSRADLSLALPPTLQHQILRVRRPEDSYPMFTAWLAAAKPAAVLSFHNSSESLEATEVFLRQKSINVRVLGSSYEVAQRCKSITDISSGKAQVLLCTEMGARGLDIPRLSHVLNFDLPSGAREYVHRAGRVGRISSLTPNRRGTVVTMAVGDEQYLQSLKMLSKDLRLSTTPMPIPRDVWGPYSGRVLGDDDSSNSTDNGPSATSILVAPLMRAECKKGELVLSSLQQEIGSLFGRPAAIDKAAAEKGGDEGEATPTATTTKVGAE